MDVLWQVMCLVVIGWLPGAALYRLPVADRDARAALDAEERAFWYVVLSVAVSLAVVIALAAAHCYTLTRLLAVDVAIAASAAGAARMRLRFGAAARAPRPSALIPLALILLGVWRFLPPAEYLMGGKDPGTYFNEGIQIAQRGTLVYEDPVVASVPSFARDLFFPSHQQEQYYGLRFMGFFIQDPARGTVVGQFPHLFPASIAVAYGLDGLTGARRVTAIWGVLGLLAVYFVGARLIGRTAAAAAAGLLALHVIEVWFARYPNAELVMQTLLFAALLANARAHIDGNPFFAPVAAALLGLLLFLRFDAVLAIAGVLSGLVLGGARGIRPRASFVVVLLLFTCVAALYLTGPLRAYLSLPTVFLSNFPWWQYALLGAVVLMAVVTLVAGRRSTWLSARVVVLLPLVLTGIVWMAAAYALFWRRPSGPLAPHDAYALRMFTDFYLTLPALLAALLGFGLVARRRFWVAPEFFSTVVIFSFFFFYKIRIWPDHFWMTRRFLPVILPAALLFAAAAALGGDPGPTPIRRRARSLIGLVFVALLAMHYSRAARPVVGHVEYAGIIPKLEHIAGIVGDDDLLIVESRNASDTYFLALPLAYVYGRNVLVLSNELPDKPTLGAFLDWARTRYHRVLFLGGGGTDLLSRRWTATPVESDRFQVPEYDAPRNAYPRFVRQKEFDYSLYELTPPAAQQGGPFDLDVGVRDDLHVLNFHAKEQSEGRTFRWSREASYVSITSLRAADRQVTLWMNDGGRSAAAPPADVSVELDGELLGSVRMGPSFRPYTLAIPAALAARAAASGEPVRMKLTTPVWNPSRVLGTGDDRELGVMVDRVAVR